MLVLTRLIPIATALLFAGPVPALALDCAWARSPSDKAICASPDARAADDAMVAAYEALRAGLPPAGRDALLRAQRNWLKRRGYSCQDDAPDLGACLARETAQWRDYLAGRPEAGPGTGAPLEPVFVQRPGRKGATEVDVALLRVRNPVRPGERAFNAEIERLLAAVPGDEDVEKDRTYSYSQTLRLTYASPRLLSARLDGYSYTGGAHGMPDSSGLILDMASGRAPVFAEVFDTAARDALVAACDAQVMVQKKARDSLPASADDKAAYAKSLSAGVSDFGNWSLSPAGAWIVFNPYELGSYAEGRYECTLPLPVLRRLSRGLPLPEEG